MRYLTAILGALFFSVMISDMAIARKHGATVTWNPSPSAVDCRSPCKGVYLIFEGPASGKEDMTKPFASTTKLRFVDDEPKKGAYSGTTRCYVIQYQETLGRRVRVGKSPEEACVTFQQITGQGGGKPLHEREGQQNPAIHTSFPPPSLTTRVPNELPGL